MYYLVPVFICKDRCRYSRKRASCAFTSFLSSQHLAKILTEPGAAEGNTVVHEEMLNTAEVSPHEHCRLLHDALCLFRHHKGERLGHRSNDCLRLYHAHFEPNKVFHHLLRSCWRTFGRGPTTLRETNKSSCGHIRRGVLYPPLLQLGREPLEDVSRVVL